MKCKYNDESKAYFQSKPRVQELFERQKQKGIAKYGKTLEQHAEGDHSEGHIVNHLEEELADAVVYSRWLMSKLKEGTPEQGRKVMALTRIVWQLNDALDNLEDVFPAKDYERE